MPTTPRAPDEEADPIVFRCTNGHVMTRIGYVDPTCDRCESLLTPVTDPYDLLDISDTFDTEKQHIIRDEAVYRRLLEIDTAFALRYGVDRDRWWHS